MSAYGFQFSFAPETSLPQLAILLNQNYGVFLSHRKLKHLIDHGWMGRKWGVIPWGFFQPLERASRLLYEDQECLAVSKPPFVSVVGPDREKTLLGCWKRRVPTISAVHRLDFETSGVVLFAKTSKMKEQLDAAFKNRDIQKTYVTMVHGAPKQFRWTMTEALQARGDGMIRASGQTPRKFKLDAETHFRCLETWRSPQGNPYSVIEACPKTGRRHQIRAHLYWSGCPVVGETLYGGMDSVRIHGIRLQLHAQRIEWVSKGKRLAIECPLPPDMLRKDMLGLNHD